MKKNNAVAIVQARMKSTRLPKKVLMEVDGIPLLRYQIDRIKKSSLLKKIVVATSTEDSDDEIENFCKINKTEHFRGSENDVLSRYYECAKEFKADTIVRLTADCPLIDSSVIDLVLKTYLKNSYDFVANTSPPKGCTYPEGMDVEVFSFQSLENAEKKTEKPSDREHVTHFFWNSPKLFSNFRCELDKDLSGYRITVDYKEDFVVVSSIIKSLYKKKPFFTMQDIVNFLDKNPDIKLINSRIKSNLGWDSSFQKNKALGF